MSIHQSKGIEFPIVVLPDLNRRGDVSRRWLTLDPELGPLVRPGSALPAVEESSEDEAASGRSFGWDVYEAREQVEDEAESLRLFYVATTRARDHLVLSAGEGPEANPASAAVRLLDSRFDRRTGACRAALPEGWASPSAAVVLNAPPPPAGPARPKASPTTESHREDDPVVEPRLAGDRRLNVGTASVPRPQGDGRALAPGLPARSPGRGDPGRPAIVRGLEVGPGGRRAVPGAGRCPAAPATLCPRPSRCFNPGSTGRSATASGARARSTGLGWSIAWPPRSSEATILEGRTEFLLVDPDGSRIAVIFSVPGGVRGGRAPSARRAGAAADVLKLGRIACGWRARLGLEGPPIEEPVSEDAVEAARSGPSWRASGAANPRRPRRPRRDSETTSPLRNKGRQAKGSTARTRRVRSLRSIVRVAVERPPNVGARYRVAAGGLAASAPDAATSGRLAAWPRA